MLKISHGGHAGRHDGVLRSFVSFLVCVNADERAAVFLGRE